MPIAFKEWAVTVRALEEGVWTDGEPPASALDSPTGVPQPERVRIRAWAEVAASYLITDPRAVDALSPYYVWTTDYAEKRLRWKRRHPLHVILLRTYRIPRPVTVKVRDEYLGCRSWLELHRELPFEGTPVLADEEFERAAEEIEAIAHSRPYELSIAQPWLPLARLAASPASRRYMAGWFSAREIHVLAPEALDARASPVEGSREALMLSPLHEYAHLAIAANNPALPPPFNPGSFVRYLRWAWLAEGAATQLAGQTPHLRAAVARRLYEGP